MSSLPGGDEPEATETAAPSTPDPAPFASPPIYGLRQLIGASFDLLGRASVEMRRASFYIGLVALGTVGPLAMGAWWLGLRSIHMTVSETESMLTGPVALWINLLAWPAVIGVIVLSVEGRAIAAAILGARVVERPLTVHQALARSRSVFWRVIGASIVSAIPIGLVQLAVEEFANSVLPVPGQASLPISLIVTAVVGGPLAYIASGVVLGDVGPVEAVRRSINVFRARKIAAMVVALFETIAALLIVFGVSAGLDLALRIFGTLGLGTDSGPVGIVLVTVGVAAATFALGTLIYTVSAIAIAPQVVMFVGLTHATMGLDHVRLGGRHDPDAQRPGVRGFRVFTRLMLFGIGVAWVGLVGLALQLRA